MSADTQDSSIASVGPWETRKRQAWACSLAVRTADLLDPGSHSPAHANELVGRAAFSGCPLFSEDNKTLTHPTNARFNNPKCLQFPYAKQNRPLLPANLKIYTPVFSLRFSTLLPFYHTEAVLVFWSWSRKRQSEVPTDWAHSQTHVIKTRGSVTCCSLLIKKLTTLDTQGSRSFLFLFLLCASMSS